MPILKALAETQPDKIACEFPETGERITYAELDRQARRTAHWMIDLGLQGGDHIAILTENHPTLFDIAWASRRAGLYYTAMSTHLKPAEIAYILGNCEAKLLIASGRYAALAAEALAQADNKQIHFFTFDDEQRDTRAGHYEEAVARFADADELPPRPVGRDLLYSSGTTGFPKGVSKPLVAAEDRFGPEPEIESMRAVFGFDPSWVYLSPGPLYHAAPLRFCMMTLAAGGTIIVMRRFDTREALRLIQQYRVTHSQWVPTMFVRMLDLPEEERLAYDVSSMRVAIHAAAPCPVHIKEKMIEWWGPVIEEYYAGSEGLGTTLIKSPEWLAHKGSVGRPLVGTLHIIDEDGNDLPTGEVGLICFADGPTFEYFNAPEKTRDAYRSEGMATYGDLGYVDEDGYLYMSDRRADLIISGGVNIYPREIEDVLLKHPEVADVVVIGIANAEFGEQVKAIVQLHDAARSSDALADQLVAHCRERISSIKVPKSVDFVAKLPRQENGKLPRRLLKAQYQQGGGGK